MGSFDLARVLSSIFDGRNVITQMTTAPAEISNSNIVVCRNTKSFKVTKFRERSCDEDEEEHPLLSVCLSKPSSSSS